MEASHLLNLQSVCPKKISKHWLPKAGEEVGQIAPNMEGTIDCPGPSNSKDMEAEQIQPSNNTDHRTNIQESVIGVIKILLTPSISIGNNGLRTNDSPSLASHSYAMLAQLGDSEVPGLGVWLGKLATFNECLFDIEVDDMRSSRAWFTWDNKRSGQANIQSKLDRVLINDRWKVAVS
ncbi:hypothetical protein F0562_007355 [Nyssa sinensis]|uniref:Uncharacterized protein n=1 Tax=Nyssa sinensis TaxID=561372 RepID=A0A5J5A4V7_9ASTE|nr:hypothetical protein F0562_007355 [Nyssa sinensis]